MVTRSLRQAIEALKSVFCILWGYKAVCWGVDVGDWHYFVGCVGGNELPSLACYCESRFVLFVSKVNSHVALCAGR